MREKRNAQTSLFDPQAVDHPVADDLERASAWLDAHPELLDEVAADLGAASGSGRGRRGLSCETALRCAVLKHLRQESYRGLEFALRDSLSARRFARVGGGRLPGKSALQATVGAIRAETWERIDRILLEAARAAGVESGDRVRIDSTAVETHILEPSDSRLLYDGVRVLTRLLAAAREELGGEAVRFHDHRRAAKRRHLEIGSQRGAEKRARTYRRLLRLLARTVGYIEAALPAVSAAGTLWARGWAEAAAEHGDLLERVVDQTRRRVFEGETVPAEEKVLSLFEPHTDIIRKGGRKTHYGHKVNFATGRSGLVLDAVVEDGNPADSARCLPMLERHVEHYGAAPSRAAFDGGYAREPRRGEGPRHRTCRVPQEARHRGGGHDPVVVDLRAAEALPRRHRGGHLPSEAVLRPRPLPLARPAALQGLRAVGGVRAQPDAPGPAAAEADLTGPPLPIPTSRAPGPAICRRRARGAAHPARDASKTGAKAPEPGRNAPPGPLDRCSRPGPAFAPSRKRGFNGQELANGDFRIRFDTIPSSGRFPLVRNRRFSIVIRPGESDGVRPTLPWIALMLVFRLARNLLVAASAGRSRGVSYRGT